MLELGYFELVLHANNPVWDAHVFRVEFSHVLVDFFNGYVIVSQLRNEILVILSHVGHHEVHA